MKLDSIVPAVILFITVGIVLGVGIIVLDQFGDSVKTAETITNESTTVSSGAATLANDEITLSSFIFLNDSSTFISGNVSTSPTVNLTTGGVLTTSIPDGTYKSTYTYDADSPSTTTTFGVRDAVDNFVTWIPVIIIIIAAAIILGLVMRSFRQ